MKEAVEEGRRWKKGGEGGIRRGIKWFKGGDNFWGFFGRVVGKFFTEEQRVRRDGRGREESWRRGLTPRGRFTLKEERSCYPVYRYVGLGARKPVGFLGPAGSLVGRVDYPSWHQGSYRLKRGKGKAKGVGIRDNLQLAKAQVFFGELSLYCTKFK